MTEIEDSTDDIALSAYIDGELPREDAQALKERLLKEPALARRLEVLRGADDDALRMYAAIDRQAMPQAVLDLLGQESTTVKDSNVIAFPKRGIQQFFQMPVAIAASVALLAGLLLGDIVRESNQANPELTGLYAGQVAADSNLHRILENGTSSQAASLSDGVNAELLLTFQDRDGDYCRQLRVDGSGAPLQGIACRRGGSWQVEAVGIAGARSPDGSYQQASGDTPASIDSAIDSLIGALPPLDLEEEINVISRGWKKLDD